MNGATLGRVTAAPDVTVLRLASATVTVGGLTGGAIPALAVTAAPTGSPAPTVVRTGSTFTVTGLDPAPPNNEGYRFNVSAPGFYAQDLPSSTTLLNPDIGFTHTFTPTLVERTVTVTVTTAGNPGDAANATVTLVNPANSAALGTLERTGSTFTFRRIAVGSDAGRITVSLNGYRQQVYDVNIAAGPVTQPAGLLPNATVSGVVRLPGGGGAGSGISVAATNGTNTTTGQGGAYTLSGFGVGSWTVSAEQLGVGAGSATVNVTSFSPSAVTSDITLTPRTVTLNVTVTPSANAASFTGATIVVTNPATNTSANGTANPTGSVTIAEAPTYNYTITATNFLPRTGTITLTALTQAVSVTVFPQPIVSGTITRVVNGNSQPQNNALIYLCADTVTTCDSTNDIGPSPIANTAANGQYSLRITTPGSYKIGAVGSGGNPPTATSAAFTVAANAAVADIPISLTLTP